MDDGVSDTPNTIDQHGVIIMRPHVVRDQILKTIWNTVVVEKCLQLDKKNAHGSSV